MKKLILILIPLILLGAYLYRPVTAPVAEESKAPVEQEERVLEPILSVRPANPIQGEPVLVTVENIPAGSSIKSLTFNGKSLYIFDDNGKSSALIGIDLRQTPGTYPITLTLSDGQVIKKNLTVGTRTVVKAPLGIPEKLGGDTPEAEKELINTLVEEGAIISAVPTSNEKLWSGKFRLPLEGLVVVTDNYGYSRITGSSNISHKGTDFRAATGTSVYAMNEGIVRFAGYLRNYGHTIIIDHGLGLHTIYMHLSERLVNLNDTVEKGRLIARSGESGYTLGPHLHISIRIGGISIDPEKFMALLGE
ncbi:MAG: M23 family metallopeptidase [bacterium]|nr:M23 family metallopeptidase [bacterium]